MGIRVISDTTSYIDPILQEKLNIKLIPLSVHFPDESYDEDKVDYDYFYEKIAKDKVIPTSSQPSPWELEAIFREILETGDDIVAIFLSSAMSGTFSHASNAKTELQSEFSNRKIEIIDSYTNCMALGSIVLAAAWAAYANAAFEEVVFAAYEARNKVHFYFTPKTLEYLKKGGRIGTASALLGSILDINAILTVDMAKGMTHLHGRTRGFDSALQKIYEIIADDSNEYGISALYVHHISAEEKAKEVKEQLAVRYPDLEIGICNIGPVIGLHVGPGTVGIVYCTEKAKHQLPDAI